MPRTARKASPTPEFVSTQVTDAQRYYLNLELRGPEEMIVVCGGWERVSPDYVVDRQTFPYLCIEFVAEGAGEVIIQGRRHLLRAGMAFAYAPGIAHRITTDPRHPMRKFFINFAGSEALQFMESSPLTSWKPLQIAGPEEILGIFSAMQRDAFAGRGLRDALCAAHLRLLLLKISQTAMPARRSQPRAFAAYQRARTYMEDHYLELKTAEDVAKRCHVTPVYLSRIFRRFAHTTPYQFLTRLQMNRAAGWLLDPGRLVKEVADLLHFATPFQFSRTFKRIYGLSPEQFIRQSGRPVGRHRVK